VRHFVSFAGRFSSAPPDRPRRATAITYQIDLLTVKNFIQQKSGTVRAILRDGALLSGSVLSVDPLQQRECHCETHFVD
jgi:hypothetical protein